MKGRWLCMALVAAVVYIFAIRSATGIKCWVCRSDGDPKCADPFDNTSFPITDCDHYDPPTHLRGIKSTMCRKIRQKVDGMWRYIRTCAYLGEPGIGGDERFCVMRTGTYNIFIEYCTCRSKDGCNTSSRSSISNGLLIVLTLVSLGIGRVLKS